MTIVNYLDNLNLKTLQTTCETGRRDRFQPNAIASIQWMLAMRVCCLEGFEIQVLILLVVHPKQLTNTTDHVSDHDLRFDQIIISAE